MAGVLINKTHEHAKLSGFHINYIYEVKFMLNPNS